MRKILAGIFFLLPLLSTAQKDEAWFRAREDSIRDLAFIALKGNFDNEKTAAALQVEKRLAGLLRIDGSWDYSFDSLKYVSVLKSPDNRFRIFTWYTINDQFEHSFYGVIQVNNRRKPPFVTVLRDQSDSIANPEKENLSGTRWYGALYYAMVVPKKKGNRNYILLGWDGHGPLTNRKLVEIINVSARGDARFGGNLFRSESNKPVKRVIFEYGENASMSLRYDDKARMIIFDHLAPSNPALKENREYYGPDFSYDAYIYKKGKWEYVKDVDARNPSFKRRYNQPGK